MIITTKTPYKPRKRAGGPLTLASLEYFIPVEMGEADPEREVLRHLLRLGCARCLDARERELIRLRYEEGLSLKIIAAGEGRSPSAVCRKLRMARTKLYRFTEEAGEIDRLCGLLRRRLQ